MRKNEVILVKRILLRHAKKRSEEKIELTHFGKDPKALDGRFVCLHTKYYNVDPNACYTGTGRSHTHTHFKIEFISKE